MLARHVYEALNADPLYYFRHISVRADDGVVALTAMCGARTRSTAPGRSRGTFPGVRRVVTTNLELELEGRGNGVSR